MRESGTALKDRTAALDDEFAPIIPCMAWDVISVQALPDFKLSVSFHDGVAGIVQMRDFLFSEGAGVFKSLRDPRLFSEVSCEEGFVMWSNELDLAPDAMHDNIQSAGGTYVMRPR